MAGRTSIIRSNIPLTLHSSWFRLGHLLHLGVSLLFVHLCVYIKREYTACTGNTIEKLTISCVTFEMLINFYASVRTVLSSWSGTAHLDLR